MATLTALEPADVESTTHDPDDQYEVVNGLIVEEPPLAAIGYWIASRLVRGIILHDSSGELGGVCVGAPFILERSPRLRRRPDIAYVSAERWPVGLAPSTAAAWDVVPDLAVEIVSPTDHAYDVMAKLEEDFRVGVRLVWVIYPEFRKVYAYGSTTSLRILQDGDELEGGPVLPGFRFPVAGLFQTQEGGPTPTA